MTTRMYEEFVTCIKDQQLATMIARGLHSYYNERSYQALKYLGFSFAVHTSHGESKINVVSSNPISETQLAFACGYANCLYETLKQFVQEEK